AERGGRNPGRHARVHAFREYTHTKVAREISPQRCRTPDLVVVAAFRIEADHEGWLTDLIAKRIQMGGQIDTAALFAGLNQQDTARQGHFLGLEGGDGSERAEHCVAVIRASTAIELAITHDRLPRTQAWQPA